jgi:Uma2 family endonuclease
MKETARPVTAEELARLPRNGMRRELVRGEVREMPPNGGEHGAATATVTIRLGSFVSKRRLGQLFGAETGFLIGREPDTVLGPDCGFVSAERLPQPIPKKFLPLAPDLAVETLSPEDRPREVREKVARWLAGGTRMVWVLDPDRCRVSVHRPGAEPRSFEAEDILEGEEVLPGFKVRVADLFPAPPAAQRP